MKNHSVCDFFHPKSSSPSCFSIIILGDFDEFKSQSNNLSSIETFLKTASIEGRANDLYYKVQQDDSSFELFILKNTDKLLYRVLFSTAQIILILPDSIEDFNCCAKIVEDYAKPEQTKIYCLDNFPKDSDEHSIITKKASCWHYAAMPENGIHCLSEIAKREYLRKIESSCTEDHPSMLLK